MFKAILEVSGMWMEGGRGNNKRSLFKVLTFASPTTRPPPNFFELQNAAQQGEETPPAGL